jgi:hypothetical protein
MNSIFFVDYENQCQNFAKVLLDAVGPSIEVFLFVRSGTKTTVEPLFTEARCVKVVEALTDGPEAADIALAFFALQKISSLSYARSNNYFIVKGSEKGYGETIAQLNTALPQRGQSKITVIDGLTKNLCDVFPKESCGFCKKLFRSESDANRHKMGSVFASPLKCRHCDTVFSCSAEQDSLKDEHTGNWHYNVCTTVGCTKVACKPRLIDDCKHPKCDCGCEKSFKDVQALQVHKNQVRVHPFSCPDCGERFETKMLVSNHQIDAHPEKHKCPRCEVICVNMKKHNKNCR